MQQRNDLPGKPVIRIIDGSGEDYLYSANRFMPLELTPPVEEWLSELAVF